MTRTPDTDDAADVLAARLAGDYAGSLTDAERTAAPPTVVLYVVVSNRPVMVTAGGGAHATGLVGVKELHRRGAILPEGVAQAELDQLVRRGLVRAVSVNPTTGEVTP